MSNRDLENSKYGLQIGTPDIKSVGPLSFGPDGILFIADNVTANIFAIDVGGADLHKESNPIDVDSLDTRLAAFLGCSKEDVFIRDMAVHPYAADVYFSVMRGSGISSMPVLIKLEKSGALGQVPTEGVLFSQIAINDAPLDDDQRIDTHLVQGNREGEVMDRNGVQYRIARDKLRTSTVTDMAYVDGVLLVAGASNEEFSSTFRRIGFPFNGNSMSNSLEIFHVSHGKYETASPIRTFVPYGDNTGILASYTCTPLVQFSLSDIKSGTQLKGKTVADLGAGNSPIDMVSYIYGEQEYLLVSNARHPLMKIACSDVDKQESLTQPNEPLGVPRQMLSQEGVGRMANLNGAYVLMMQQDHADNIELRSYSIATL